MVIRQPDLQAFGFIHLMYIRPKTTEVMPISCHKGMNHSRENRSKPRRKDGIHPFKHIEHMD
jgi:hypothetical protein